MNNVGADVCVIGGGIIALATARAILARDPGASIIVVEKEVAVGSHQTGHNSGVIHSGVFYPPGSLKSRFSIAGARATAEFCRATGTPVRVCGKYIVATTDAELGGLERLAANATAVGLEHGVASGLQLRRREPAITGLRALFVPSTAIVDYASLATALAADLDRRGVRLFLGEEVIGIRETARGVRIRTTSRRIQADRLIACAGLQSDRIARMSGIDSGVRIVPFRGEYYRLTGPPLVDSLIYPVPDPGLPFLGIHISPLVGGGVSVGPSAVLGRAREGYRKRDVSLRDIADYAAFPGLWRLAARHAGTGMREVRHSLVKRSYLGQVHRYAPTVRARDLRPYRAGIRAQALRRDGTLVDDFLIERTDRMVHVLNAPSPAATAAFPIGGHLAGLL